MTKELNEQEFRKYLSAFADGELDVEQNLQVLQYLSMHPEATKRVMHQQQIRQAVGRSVVDSASGAPDELRGEVMDLATSVPVGSIDKQRATSGGWVWRWTPAIAALLMLVISIFVLQQANDRSGWPYPHIMTASLAKKMAFRHEDCGCDVAKLQDNGVFPKSLKKLPNSIGEYLGSQSVPGLDLKNATGFEFKGVGKCMLPSDGSVHMVYGRKGGDGKEETLSLWMKPYKGQPTIEPNQVYYATPPGYDHPILVWRQETLIYYLVGDSYQGTEAAIKTLRGE